MTDDASDSWRSNDHRQLPADSPSQSPADGTERPSRRQYLGFVAAAAGALGGCLSGNDGRRGPSISTSPPPESSTADRTQTAARTSDDRGTFRSKHGIEFDRVLDAVDDLGLDSTGVSPVNDRLESALEEGTLVRFPEGKYRFDGSVSITERRVGVLGDGGVTFRPTDGFDGLLFDGVTAGLDRVLIENVDIDIRAPDTTAGIRLACSQQFHVQDVRLVGRGTTRSSGGTMSAFLLSIREKGGRGVLRNAIARKGSRIDGYAGGNGRIGVWVGWANKGTVRIENCDFREFGNNGTYTSRTPGNVEVVDSYFLNNNVAGVRIGGKGSYVENCTVEIDMDKYTGPMSADPESLNTRGIVVEQGLAKAGPPLPAGAEIRECTVIARSSPLAQAAIEQSPQARSLQISDTDIQCDIDGTPAVRRGPPGAIQYRPERQTPPRPHWTRLRNVRIDGSAAGGAAIDLHGASRSLIEDCTVYGPGADRDGIRLTYSPRTTIRGGTIRTAGYPTVLEIDPETPSDRGVLCLDTASVLQQFTDTTGANDLTVSPPLLQVLQRGETDDAVCLGLDTDIDALLRPDALSEPVLIGIVGHERGIPLGLLLSDR